MSAQRLLCVFVCEVHSFSGYHLADFKRTAPPNPHQKLKSVGVQPLGFGKGWSPSQGRNSASSKEKFAYIKEIKSVSPNTEQTKANASHKAANQKSRMHKRQVEYQSPNSQNKKCRPSTACGALTDNIAERR